MSRKPLDTPPPFPNMRPHMEGWIIPDDKIPLNGRTGYEPEEESSHPSGPLWRYGMLALCLCLLGRCIHWWLNLSPGYPYDRYGTGIVVICLILLHLKQSFRWPRRTAITISVLAHGWLIFADIWVSYLSNRIYG